MNEQKTMKMKKNETKENKIDIDIHDNIISTYIIPYNESYDYVFISELFRQEHVKPYLKNIKKRHTGASQINPDILYLLKLLKYCESEKNSIISEFSLTRSLK